MGMMSWLEALYENADSPEVVERTLTKLRKHFTTKQMQQHGYPERQFANRMFHREQERFIKRRAWRKEQARKEALIRWHGRTRR